MKYNCKLLFLILILVLNSLDIYALEFKGDFKQGSFILGKTKPGAKVFIDKDSDVFYPKSLDFEFNELPEDFGNFIKDSIEEFLFFKCLLASRLRP